MKIKMTLRQVRTTIIVFALMLFSAGVGYYGGQHEIKISSSGTQSRVTIDRKVPLGKEDVDFSLFWETWDKLKLSYLDKSALDDKKMVYGAIQGMVSSLGDPYTVFLPPTEQKQSRDDLAGEFDGVGIQLGYKDEKLAVIAPLSGTPADKAGVKAGDLILKIKDVTKSVDKETTGMTLPEAVNLIRGSRGTKVILTFLREGEPAPFDIDLTRGVILVKSVEVKIDKGIARLSLTRFGEKTNQEWDESVNKILAEQVGGNAKGVVFDLRNNPGGFLQGAVYIASEFLADGVVVKQENAGELGTDVLSVNRKGRLLDIPLIVLVNQGSASASEIVAGALQERGRAKLVGEKTFGKGTVQEAEELPGGSGLHVTIAKWLLPNGTNIHKEGIRPDFEVKMDTKDQTKDPQLDMAMELLKNGN
ncbi:MAG: S41 family peptidase [bacterium]|nr:S41 family peptidase [bacterium]